ncbi:MAG: MotA/TolQ/ExbB proton channel family protein [Thermoguttaceae bacterium]
MKSTYYSLWASLGLICLFSLLVPLGSLVAGESGARVAAGESAGGPAGGPAGDTGSGQIPTRNLWNIMQDGGILMYPLAGCSLLLVAVAFERIVSLRRGRIIPRPFVRRFLEQIRDGELDRDGALQLCAENRSPVAIVFAGAVRKWGRPGVEVEQAIIDSGERVTNDLRRYLRVFNGIATVCPLLGLLGTVFGMIAAFNVIAASDAMGRPELLANGISEALLTTAAGLSIAIPALIFYMYFVSRVDRLIIDMDALAQGLANLISAEELEREKKPEAAKPRRSAKKEAA